MLKRLGVDTWGNAIIITADMIPEVQAKKYVLKSGKDW